MFCSIALKIKSSNLLSKFPCKNSDFGLIALALKSAATVCLMENYDNPRLACAPAQ